MKKTTVSLLFFLLVSSTFAGLGFPGTSIDTNTLKATGGFATNLTVTGLSFSGPVTGLVSQVVLQDQTESQRLIYVGQTNELVRNREESRFPVTVFDGSTTGGTGLVSWDGALVMVGEEYLTNTVDWSGWFGTGSITNGQLVLDDGEYIVSPLLVYGILDYVDSIFAPGAGSSWDVIVYTNTTATPVSLPYFGQDAHLRVEYGSTAPLIGDMFAGVSIPCTNGIIIRGVDRPDVLDDSGLRFVPQHELLEEPDIPTEAARLSTVKTWYTNATVYADDGIVEYHRDAAKLVRCSKMLLSNDWNLTAFGSETNRVLDVAAGGVQIARHDVGIGYCTINAITLNNTNDSSEATILVSTNGVGSSPVLEWTGDLDLMEWQLPLVTSNSYPAADGSNYVIIATIPDDDVGYYRAVQKDGESQTTIYSDWIVFPNIPASSNGLPSGALYSDSGTLMVVP